PGHRRARDLALEVPSSPLEAVMSGEVWQQVYDRLAELIEAHRTTLVFVNTRRLAERVTRQLSERVGADRVTAHHGSLAKEQRFEAEQRLKAGALKALVATASLELGIDIGDVDLVCQLGLPREDFNAVIAMLADGFSTRRGRRGALIHYDAVNHKLRGRRGARLTALTSGGTIPDNADYQVLLEPENHIIGTVNEDFAVESMAGDVFQLGNRAYRLLRVERGTLRVEDAEGAAPNIPFWLGEAPGRTDELSQSVSRLRAQFVTNLP